MIDSKKNDLLGPGDREPTERPAEAPRVCRKLRTKMAFGSHRGGPRDWRFGDSATAVYWCLRTMETAGPDDGLAHPHGCQAGRACFVPPPGDEGDPVA